MGVTATALLALAAGIRVEESHHRPRGPPRHRHSMLRVGDPAPDFSATSHTGATVSLSDYRGKKLMLWFYPRAGTGG